MIKIDQTILEAAIQYHGEGPQLEMIIEECSELIQALQKRKRKLSAESILAVIDELADVRIVTEQGIKIFGEDAVQKRVDFKLKRLQERLSKGTY